MRYSGKVIQAIIVVVLLVMISAILGCAGSVTPSPTTTSTPTSKPTPSATAPAPIVLKWAQLTPENAYGKSSTWMAKEFEKRSGGKIKVEIYWAATLAPADQVLTAVRTGVADVGVFLPAYAPGTLPLGSVTQLPVIVMDTWSGLMAQNELVTMPELQAEFQANNVVYFGGAAISSANIISRKPIRTLNDLKGLKIQALGETGNLLARLGASIVTMAPTELYDALQRGTIDANTNNPAYAGGYKLHEVANYWYKLPLGGITHFIFFNKDTWDKLPSDMKQLALTLQSEQAAAFYKSYEVQGDSDAWNLMKPSFKEVVEASASEVNEVLSAVNEVAWSKWVDRANEKKLPGQKILDKWIELNKKYQAQAHPK